MKALLTLLLVIFSFGIKAQNKVPPPPPIESPNLKDTSAIFDSVEIEASFPGGPEAWRNYLVNNFKVDSVSDIVWQQLPDKVKRKKGMLQITAIVQFIVCKDGSLCEVKTINDVPAAFKTEAERLITESSLWLPAEQNKRKVKAYRRQPITMQIPIE
jgi:periplasmic protein TonB